MASIGMVRSSKPYDRESPQAKQRGFAWLPDQHGRIFGGTYEKSTGDFAETPQPSGWTAPRNPAWAHGLFVPDGTYITVEAIDGKPKALHINYEKWKGVLNQALTDHEARRMQLAENLTSGHMALELAENPTPRFAQRLGPAPFPPLAVIVAMEEGDPWALGNSAEIPEWALEVFGPDLEGLKRVARQMKLLSPEAARMLNAEEREQTKARAALKTLNKAKIVDVPAKRMEKARAAKAAKRALTGASA